jgi:hypothetical protein
VARARQPALRQVRADQPDPFESSGYLLGLLTQACLVCRKPRLQILRVAIEDAGNLHEAETEATQRDGLRRSHHRTRVVGTPSRSSAIGDEQAVLLVETQCLGGYAECGARLRGAEATGRWVHGSPWMEEASFIEPAPGARSRRKVYGTPPYSHRCHQWLRRA